MKPLYERALDAVAQRLLRRVVRVPARASSPTEDELERRTEEFNQAAEAYYANYPYPAFLETKPFGDKLDYPRYLFNLGVLFQGLRLAPGDLVLELGAGSCWVSHFLNLYGCRTIAVDVSETALDYGRALFRKSSQTRWELEPRFLSYDGRRLPVETGSCDRIVIHDAFHHIPNQEQILREMARVLCDGSVVAMCEPGRAHSGTEMSRGEMETGVLENDLVVEELAELAKRCGFSATTVLPVCFPAIGEVPAGELVGFVQGRGFADYWSRFSAALLDCHYLLLYKGEFRPSSRRAAELAARIELAPEPVDRALVVGAGETPILHCTVTNTGRARWIGSGPRPGLVCLGGHLFREGSEEPLDWDWVRVPLGEDVQPGERRRLEIELPPLDGCGRYRLELDMVAEDVAWFAEGGSPAVSLALEIQRS